jgi:flagellar basal body P-ring formation protein FlgA
MKLISTLVLALLATPAEAAPVLRSEVTVNHAIVTAGDMFEDAGLLAEKAMFRAPAPGTAGIVSLESVRAAAAAIGLSDFDAEGVLRVRVVRAATLVDAAMLTTLIADDLAARGIVRPGIDVAARFDREIAFQAEAVDMPVTLVNLRYMPENGGFVLRALIAGMDAPVDLSGRIELTIEAPHLVATRPAGTILMPEDIEMRPVPLRNAESSGVATLDQLVGKQLTRQSRGGLMLKLTDVTEPQVVERNAMVTVIFQQGPMTLTVRGQALNNAAAGGIVQVLNPASRKILHGVALPNGAVELSTTTISVAGL